jgi:uncharacterized protein YbjQ (UPF0145 family)
MAGTSHCYLWVPNALLADGLTVMENWGFAYKANLVWHKVRMDGGSDGRGAARVFTSNLSGQELYLLERSGHTPVGLVMGVCVYHVARRSLGSWWSGMGRNIELANPTTALYDSREIAMSRLQQEALQAGAAGVVGVRIDQRSHVWGSRVVEFVAIGTAVTSTAAPGTALTGMAASGTARSYLPLGVRFAVPLDDPVRATDPRRLLGG